MSSAPPGFPDDPLFASLRDGTADVSLRHLAAQRLLPMLPEDELRVLLALSSDPDPAVAAEAADALAATPGAHWLGLLASVRLGGAELDRIASHCREPEVLERIVRAPDTPVETLLRLSSVAEGTLQEALVVNQARLLASPELIDALFENPRLTADSRRRLEETREEFFVKLERRLRQSQAEGAGPAPVADAGGQPREEAPAEASGEDAEAAPRRELEIHQRLSYLTASQKIEAAITGSREERAILILDASKMVRDAVLRCPKMTDQEVCSIASMRSVDEEIFRKIAAKAEWMRRYPIVLALVQNPKTPPDIGVTLVKNLRVRDLRLVYHDRNLPEAVRVAARKFFNLKAG